MTRKFDQKFKRFIILFLFKNKLFFSFLIKNIKIKKNIQKGTL